MKNLLVWLVGILLGGAAGLAVLYVNPFSMTGSGDAGNARWTLVYGLPEPDPVIWTDGGLLGLPHRPTAIDALWESTIRRTGLGVYGLKSAPEGLPVAVATRVSVPRPDSELLLRGAVLSDFWLLTVPGEGSLFLHLDNNIWPFLKDVWVPVRYLQGQLRAPVSYASTIGPGTGQAGVLIGANGRFADLRAAAREQFEIAAFDRQRQQGTGRLQLEIDAPPLPGGSGCD